MCCVRFQGVWETSYLANLVSIRKINKSFYVCTGNINMLAMFRRNTIVKNFVLFQKEQKIVSYLRDYANTFSQTFQQNFWNIHVINGYASFASFHDTKQG